MQETKKYIVFRDKETGGFLKDFKSKGTLAFDANFTNEIETASVTTMDAYETQKEQFEGLAKAMDCEVVVVEATFELKYLNGGEVKEIERGEDAVHFKKAFKELLSIFAQEEN